MDIIKRLENRILEIKHKQGENHIGSCLTTLPILYRIYKKMGKGDKCILSSGHAGVALYVVLEKFGFIPLHEAEKLESHPQRNEKYRIWASTGSLGHGIGIAVGMAMLRKSEIYCVITDGESCEGSVWEALRLAEKLRLYNFHLYVNANGWGGLERIDTADLRGRLNVFSLDIKVEETNSDFGRFRDLESHYQSLNEKDYEEIVRI